MFRWCLGLVSLISIRVWHVYYVYIIISPVRWLCIVSCCWPWCSAIENFLQCSLVFYDVDYHNSKHVVSLLILIYKFFILWCPFYSNPLKYIMCIQELMRISICHVWGIHKNPYHEFQLQLRRFMGEPLPWTWMELQSFIKFLVTQSMELLNNVYNLHKIWITVNFDPKKLAAFLYIPPISSYPVTSW